MLQSPWQNIQQDSQTGLVWEPTLNKKYVNPNPPGPCLYHRWYTQWSHLEGPVCSIFIEIMLKRQPNRRPLQVCSILYSAQHIFTIQPSKIISKYDFKESASYLHNSRGN